jgi:hypothetical protein
MKRGEDRHEDYEEREKRLLGYIHPVRTSQETLRLRYRVQPVYAM